MSKPNTNGTPDFKASFAAAKASGVTVIECGAMEDYFQISAMEVHERLGEYVEFAVRAAGQDDLVALEEVTRHINNLAALAQQMNLRMHSLQKSMTHKFEAQKALEREAASVKTHSNSLLTLMSHELGMEIMTEE